MRHQSVSHSRKGVSFLTPIFEVNLPKLKREQGSPYKMGENSNKSIDGTSIASVQTVCAGLGKCYFERLHQRKVHQESTMILGFRKLFVTFLALAFPVMVFSETITLEQVIRETCAKSDSAKMMKETISKSKATVSQNWSAALPTLSASVSGSVLYGPGVALQTGQSSFSGPPIPDSMLGKPVTYGALNAIFAKLGDLTAPSQANLYKSSIQLTQPIFTFGKISTAIHVADQFDKSIQSSTNRGTQQLQLLAVDAFYWVVICNISLDVSNRSLARKTELYEFLDRNFKLGSGSKAQLLFATADMKSQVPIITKATQDLFTAKMNLNMLTGHPLLDPVELDTNAVLAGLLAQPLPSEQEAVHRALDTREDLRSLEYLAEATRGGAKIYHAMYLPSIAATGSFGTQGGEPKDLVDWDSKTWMVGVGLQWSIFDGFSNREKAQIGRAHV
jgi:outer membrane protein TolC